MAARKRGGARDGGSTVIPAIYNAPLRPFSYHAAGLVTVNGKPVLKAGTGVDVDKSSIALLADPPKFVCRAGLKLEAALDTFGLDVRGKTALDSGLSTGGFTDCLLQRGALRVVGVDVGYGQVAHSIRTHPSVVLMERTNLRHLRRTALPEDLGEIDLVTLDLSFISGGTGKAAAWLGTALQGTEG